MPVLCLKIVQVGKKRNMTVYINLNLIFKNLTKKKRILILGLLLFLHK